MTMNIQERRDWLRTMAEAEDRFDSVSVGGLASDLGMLHIEKLERLHVFALLIEYARRERRMSVEQLAGSADVDLSELVSLERDENAMPTPRTVFQLAQVLKLSTSKLMVLAGLADVRDKCLTQAAVRFAARSEPTAKLSMAEREAYEEFVKVLVDASDES